MISESGTRFSEAPRASWPVQRKEGLSGSLVGFQKDLGFRVLWGLRV